MAQLFDRFGRLLRSMVNEPAAEPDFGDQEMRDAWDELESYLAGDDAAPRTTPPEIPERLRPDYTLLGLQFGASPQLVQQAFKRELRQYHPDRNMDDQARMARATERTREIIAAYKRILAWEKGED